MGRPLASALDVATPQRLLEAAEIEFAASGFKAARLEDVASRAGIRRPSLLYHFPTKQALYSAVVQRAFVRLRLMLLETMNLEAGIGVRLEKTVAAFSKFLEANPTLAAVLLREMIDGRGPGHEIILNEVVPLLNEVVLFVKRAGTDEIRPGLPIRAAILQLVADALLRVVAGPISTPLWGKENHARTLTRILFLKEAKNGRSAPDARPRHSRSRSAKRKIGSHDNDAGKASLPV